MADDDNTPPEDFAEMLRRLMGSGQVDPEALARLTGGTMDAAALSQMMQSMFSQLSHTTEIDWSATRTGALHLSNKDAQPVTPSRRAEIGQAFSLAELWLSEATSLSPTGTAPQVLTRGDWVEASVAVWQEVALPVATSISDALTEAMRDQVPEEMHSMVDQATALLRSVGGTLFAHQLGQVVGNLAKEVITGADSGIPVLPAGTAALLPQNIAQFADGLGIADDQLLLVLAVRELASSRLFAHSKWLRLHILSQISDYAHGIRVDTDALEDLAARFDPSDPEELRAALSNGALLPSQTEDQQAALTRLETLLALVEGWVSVVTEDAALRVPELARITEAVQRRRAAGGPAEDALGALVGLSIRPRRLREAAAMWRAVSDAVGAEARDALWDYPDLIPGANDIDDPSALIARLSAQSRGEAPPEDELDAALAQLFAEEATKGGTAASDEVVDTAEAEAGEDRSDDERPV